MVWDTPASGQFEVEQPGWTAFTGQSFEELRGWGWLNVIHPGDQAETKRLWSAAFSVRLPYEVEHRMLARDGTYRNMAGRAVPILAKDGTIVQWIGVHTDITERKRMEARYRQLVESNVQGVLFWNRNGGVTGANDAFLRLVRYTREELDAGLINWMALTPPEYAHLDRRALEEISATGVSALYEKEYILKDGSRVPILLAAAAFADNPE